MPTAHKPKTKAKATSDAAATTQETEPKGPAGADQVAEVAPEVMADLDSGALLQRLWSAQVKVLLEIVENTPANEIQAATLATIQRFLGDNNIRAETVERRKQELEQLQKQANNFHNPFSAADGYEDYRRQREGIPDRDDGKSF